MEVGSAVAVAMSVVKVRDWSLVVSTKNPWCAWIYRDGMRGLTEASSV